MKLTPWYPGTVKPVRDGVYERKFPLKNSVGFTRFANGRWYLSWDTLDRALRDDESVEGIWQDIKWRGVAK